MLPGSPLVLAVELELSSDVVLGQGELLVVLLPAAVVRRVVREPRPNHRLAIARVVVVVGVRPLAAE